MQNMKFQTNDGLDSLFHFALLFPLFDAAAAAAVAAFSILFVLCFVTFCFDFDCYRHRNVHTHNLFQFSLFIALPFQMTIHFSRSSSI